ncbi:hypothetical protein AB0H43_12475 [Hamadaea sp. NPDC050747]|uniref:hypothetical protein n=1 Tax=Hamadaea sp. NPDC050747 TaxID=3155789 RepID=UPI0033EF370F
MAEFNVEQNVFEDPVVARRLRVALERLQAGSDPVLRDLAKDILAGRMHPRDIAHSSAAAAALQKPIEQYKRWRASISDDDFALLTERAAAQLQKLREQADREDNQRAG